MTTTRLRVGVSACLVGRKVRYDGGHRRDDFVADLLGTYVDFVEVCPELELGLGVPRPKLHLEGEAQAPRMVVTSTGEDLSARMRRFAATRTRGLGAIDGYVLKSRSPSCGFVQVPVFRQEQGGPSSPGRGLFAEALVARYPLLPIEDEARLQDPVVRENFVQRLFAYQRFRLFRAASPGAKDLIAFHAAHKMTLAAHHPAAYRQLGRLVADAGRRPSKALLDAYGEKLMAAMARIATRKQHADVLHHLQGHLNRLLDAADRAELTAAIDAYRRGESPRIVPLSLLQHHFRRHPSDWVAQQTYLHPHPAELNVTDTAAGRPPAADGRR